MAFCAIQFFGESIQKASGMHVIVPETPGPFPALYLLHGLSDDHTIWHRRTSIERYAADRGLIVVMPDGHRSWYCNDPRPGGLAYEDHIVKDVVGFVDRTFPTVNARGGRAIAGLSMGGYGALMLAMRHADMFAAACAHSAAVGLFRRPPEDRPDVAAAIEALPRRRYDCFALAKRLARSPRRLAIRMDCGTEDFLIERNREFHAHLDALGVEHTYAEYPGEHTWAYWDTHVQETLDFAAAHVSAG